MKMTIVLAALVAVLLSGVISSCGNGVDADGCGTTLPCSVSTNIN